MAGAREGWKECAACNPLEMVSEVLFDLELHSKHWVGYLDCFIIGASEALVGIEL